MGLIAKQKSESSIPAIEGGTYPAVCYGIVDIGTQKTTYLGQAKLTRQIVILWEIPDERIDLERDGKMVNLPRGISRTYTNSLSEKAHLFKDLTNWRGRPFTEAELEGFDMFTVVRANCLLQIMNKTLDNNKVIAFVSGLLGPPKGTPKREPENKIALYSINDNGINIPETLPDWLKKKIAESMEITGMKNAANNPELAKAQDRYRQPSGYAAPDPADLQSQVNDNQDKANTGIGDLENEPPVDDEQEIPF